MHEQMFFCQTSRKNRLRKRNKGKLEELRARHAELAAANREEAKRIKRERDIEMGTKLINGEMCLDTLLSPGDLRVMDHYNTTKSLESTIRHQCGDKVALNVARGLESGDDQVRYAYTKLSADILTKAESERMKQEAQRTEGDTFPAIVIEGEASDAS